MALLAGPSPTRANGIVSQVVVFAAADGACLSPCQNAGIRRTAESHRRLREGARRRRCPDLEVLDAPGKARPKEAVEEARTGSTDALARQQAAVEALADVRRLR